VLEELFAGAFRDSELRKERISQGELEKRVSDLASPLDVYASLAPAPKIKLIAEIKRRSPSKGFLADIPDAAAQARIYEEAGAHAISVLTEQHGFGGSLDDLAAARKAVQIPLLRKDFISTEYQILEARVAGADFVLLILAGLEDKIFSKLYEFALSLGLGVLVETHNEREIGISEDHGARLVGVNTRDLKTFTTDIGLFERLAGALPSSTIKVAESSVKTVSDVVAFRNAGADVVLVGEALVTGDAKALIPEIISV
jgi:indole-3-glycerol phosphate synthase